MQEQAIRHCCKHINSGLVDVVSDEGINGSNGLDARIGSPR